MELNTLLPLATFVVTLIFAVAVLRRYWLRRGTYLLLWGVGLLLYDIGSFCEFYLGATRSWNDLAFRAWYLCGALLVAAWLGQGTLQLLTPPRLARISLFALLVVSLVGVVAMLVATLDPRGFVAGSQLTGVGVVPAEVRVLAPILNIYGTVSLVGGAVYSAWIFWRKRVLGDRMIGNVLIAVGALAPATAGALSRLGLAQYLYLGEFVGAVLMFIGFWRATSGPQAQRRVDAPRQIG
jgi:hypothetical protein